MLSWSPCVKHLCGFGQKSEIRLQSSPKFSGVLVSFSLRLVWSWVLACVVRMPCLRGQLHKNAGSCKDPPAN